MSDSEADENTCLMSSESTSQLCSTEDSPMERDLVSIWDDIFVFLCLQYMTAYALSIHLSIAFID